MAEFKNAVIEKMMERVNGLVEVAQDQLQQISSYEVVITLNENVSNLSTYKIQIKSPTL